MGFTPTDEQLAALALFHRGDSMVIEALAGTGKTSTLRLMAWATKRQGRYVAFNKAIADDVQGAMPGRVGASTAHSLAFRAIGKRYSHRLESGRMRGFELAERLDLKPVQMRVGSVPKTLSDAYLGGLVMRSIDRFCQTADLEPHRDHVRYIDGIDMPNKDGTRGWENNNRVRDYIEPSLQTAWADLRDRAGQLPFKHGHYLKLWQLSEPRIPCEFLMLDEAQDLNPVLDAIAAAQGHAQRIYVGDAAQAIYEWTGAINAMASFKTDHRSSLTQSFGQPLLRRGPGVRAGDCRQSQRDSATS